MRRGTMTTATESWSETDGYGIPRIVSQAGLKRRYSYDAGVTWRANARKAREAAGVPEPWYWLAGVPYCPACVEGDSGCMSDDEMMQASRSPRAAYDCKCACCGEKS
jgi:hypothetical protein